MGGNYINPYTALGAATYATKTDAQQVFCDILPRIWFKDSSSQTVNQLNSEQIQFIKEYLVPPFSALKKRWPVVYKSFMRKNISDLKIVITDYEDHRYRQGKNIGSAAIHNRRSDKATIYVNKHELNKYFDKKELTDGVYHELMHSVSYFSIKDNLFINKLSGYIDKKYNNILHRLAKDYMERQKKLDNKFADFWFKTVSMLQNYNNPFELCELIKNTYKSMVAETRCWHRVNQVLEERPLKHRGEKVLIPTLCCYKTILDSEEMLAELLTHYFGTKDEKERIKELEPEIYKLLEEKIVPLVNKNI
ncbi:MAG: hypothetical protein ABIH00_00365 [Armatimonadota bacterium]